MTGTIVRTRHPQLLAALIPCALVFGLVFATPALAMGSGGGSMGGSMGGGMSSTPAVPKKPTETRNYLKAVELINEGEYEDAIAKLKKVERDAPNDADVLNYLGYASRKLGKNEDSLAYYTRALQADPNHKGANEYLGELYLQMGDLAKAEAQRAKLDQLCSFGCAELQALKAAIEDYKAKQGAGAMGSSPGAS
jgi:hypothetical protein